MTEKCECEWRPIATAPKIDPRGIDLFNGPEILLTSGSETRVGWWTTAYPAKGDWVWGEYCDGSEDECGSYHYITPTHWMPLPTHPKEPTQ